MDRSGIGVLGGTFDPPHAGHLAVATAARDALDLAEVLLVVACEPWQKVMFGPITAAADRLAMVEAAVRNEPGLTASPIEIERGGPSYMVDTLGELGRRYPDHDLYLILGADAAAQLDTWERHEDLHGLATLVIVDRPGVRSDVDPPGWTTVHVSGPHSEVSSSEIRDALVSGRPVDGMVPAAVLTQIQQRGLYGVGRS